MPAADKLIAGLEQLPQALRDAYPRGAHRGRLEQIEAHVATLLSLAAQLPDEEAREAKYEEELLALHAEGKIVLPSAHPELDPTDADNYSRFAYPQHAFERLAEGLARNGAS